MAQNTQNSQPSEAQSQHPIAAKYARERAIAPELMAAFCEYVEDRQGWETYRALGWAEPRPNAHQVPHSFGSLLSFRNDGGSLFQAKPEKPRESDGKPVKYEPELGAGLRIFTPPIPQSIRQTIAQVSGHEIPEAADPWEWIAGSPEIPIVLTEGPGKVGAGLSAGHVTIGGMGNHGFVRANEMQGDRKIRLEAPKLIESLKPFTTGGRRFYVAIDQDTKPQTIRNNNVAISRLGSLLEAEGCEVFVVRWPGQGGKTKGMDDLIAQCGPKAWEDCLEKALTLQQWRKHVKTPSTPLTHITPAGLERLQLSSKAAAALAEEWGETLAWSTETESFWRYDAGCWEELPEILIQQQTQGAIDATGQGYSADYVSGIIKLFKGLLAIRRLKDSPGLLPFRNGVLDLGTNELLEHDPKYHFTWQLPYNYTPGAECGPIVEWLRWTQFEDEGRVQVLRAYLKAVVTGRYDLQRYIELIGPGGRGKSTFMNLAIALVGLENTHATSLKRLEENRFETACLFGKRLIYITDAERYGGEVSVFKAITGLDTIPYERKYKQAGASFVSTAVCGLVANEPIASADYTSGLQRRRLTVPFTRPVAPSERRSLINITRDGVSGEFAELLPGLVNWVLAMPDSEMVAYLVDTENTVPSLAETAHENLIATNPLAEWLDTNCVWAPGHRTRIGNAVKQRRSENAGDGSTRSWDEYMMVGEWLYPNYRQYCDRVGSRPISIRRFGDLLIDLCQAQLKQDGVDKGRDREGAYIEGIALRAGEFENHPCPITEPQQPQTEANSEDFPQLEPNDRASAEKLMGLLKSARSHAEVQQFWYGTAGLQWNDAVRRAVLDRVEAEPNRGTILHHIYGDSVA